MSTALGDLAGNWRRLILSIPDQCVDTLTRVDWVQGPGLYVDLRQPNGLSRKVQASCLAEVLPPEALLLATQEGFAGEFVLAGNEAEWLRFIDFRPAGPLGDKGRLERHGDLMVELGIEADYIEHWQREPEPHHAVSAAARFNMESDGRAVILVRHGNRFGYARERLVPLAPRADLRQLIEAASAQEAQALVDCEIAVGTITPRGWRIDRSTLPWREGGLLVSPEPVLKDGRLLINDMDAHGLPISRILTPDEQRGDFRFEERPATSIPAFLTQAPERAFQSVPVVDISALGSGDAVAEAAAVDQLRLAAERVGFLHITGHGIAPAVTERLMAAAMRLFDLPVADKMACYIGGSTNHRGYVPEGEETLGEGKRDRKEAFDLALDLPAGEVPQGHPMLGPNQWPALPYFREDVMAYYAAAFHVGLRVMRGLAMALGQKRDSLDHLVATPPSQLRLIHYPHDTDAVDAPGIGAHTDYECFTLLLATGPGLEVMNQDGHWIDAPPVPGALVVNIGDMMEFWSGGRFIATSHRVRKVAQERYSFPLFFALDYDVELSPLGQKKGRHTIRTGEHLFAQTAQTFRYLKERAARGDIALPDAAMPVSSFGQEARQTRNDNHQQPRPA